MDYDSDNTPRYLELTMTIPKKYNLCLAGIIIKQIVSDKADRKEREMNNGSRREQGRYLAGRGHRSAGLRRWIQVTVLLAWDGVLLYMIADCLIVPVYGAVFIGVITFYLGYQL